MPPTPYRVVNSQKVAEEFQALLVRAAAEGRLEAVLLVMRNLVKALRWVPEEVGESAEELPSGKTVRRRLVQEPLTVEFAVNEQERVVFFLRFHLWPLKPG
jgi:hypothetical protein